MVRDLPTSASRYSRLLGWLLSACFLAMAGTLGWYYIQQRTAVEAVALRELMSIVDIETAQIANWRRERIGDGRVAAALMEMDAAERILTGKGTVSDERDVMKLMTALTHEFGYRDISLVDREGSMYVRLESAAFPDSRIRKANRAALARSTTEPTLSDIGTDRAGARLLTLTVPVQQAGALILEIDPTTFLYPYLRSWRDASRTGETFLVRVDGGDMVYLSELRYRDASQLQRRRLSDLRLPQGVETREKVVFRGSDYRGVEVLGGAHRVPGSSWFLVAKEDLAEVHAPLTRLGWELAGALTLIAIAVAAGSGWIWKGHQLRMHQESEERFRSFANDTPALLWMIAANGESVFVNKGLSAFLGAGEQDAEFDWQRYIHPDDYDRVRGKVEACFRERARFEDEIRMRRADGEYRWVLGQAQPRFGADGELLAYAGTLLDITDRKEAEHQLQQANAVLAVSLAETTAKEAEIRALSARLIHAQEEERRRLSRELHDDLSQQIAALSIGIGNLKRGLPREQSDITRQFDRFQQRLVDVSESVRRMSHELHPSILQHAGLAATLRGFCREFQELSGVAVELKIDGDFSGLSQDVALAVFRIAQEALRNVAKHARVNAAEIELARYGAEVRLVVQDAGVGLPPAESGKRGLGLVSIRERTRLVDGAVEIESAPGEGTRITVHIPCTGQTSTAAT